MSKGRSTGAAVDKGIGTPKQWLGQTGRGEVVQEQVEVRQGLPQDKIPIGLD